MTEIQELNRTPLSQAIKSILFPYRVEETIPYLFQWIQLTIGLIEAENPETELTETEMIRLEGMTCCTEEDAKTVYMALTQPVDGTAEDLIYEVPELMQQIDNIKKAAEDMSLPEDTLLEEEVTLLEMLAENIRQNGTVL